MSKLTDTQTMILSRAATRPGNLAMPLPKGLFGAAAKMAVTKMIERGWLEEVEANLRRGEPLWRETGDGHGTTLIATEAGLEAIGIEPIVANTVAGLRKAKHMHNMFGQYVTTQVRDAVMAGEVKLGGDRQQVTMLMTDMQFITGSRAFRCA